MAAPNIQTGFYGTATVASTELEITGWSVTPKATTLKFVNSKSGTIPVYRGTTQEFPITLDVDYDPANDFQTSAPNIAIGSVINGIELFYNQTAKSALNGPNWTFQYFYCETLPTTLKIDGKVIQRITGYGFGTYSRN